MNEQLLSLLERAYTEGVESQAEVIAKTAQESYKAGHSDALKNLPVLSEKDENIHNVENYAVKGFLDSAPSSYAKSDISKIYPFVTLIQEQDDPTWTECPRPYIVQANGDLCTLTDGERTFEYTPYRNTFFLYDIEPCKSYSYKVTKKNVLVTQGNFVTEGRVRMVRLEKVTNCRDLGVSGKLGFGKIFRAANLDDVEVGSKDHETLKKLGITTQIDLRDASKGKARTDLFEKAYNYAIVAYTPILTSTANVANAFKTIVETLERGESVLINCKAGADRTGTLSYFLQALCGVDLRLLELHWELTSLGRWCNFKAWDYERSGSSFPKGELRTLVTNLTTKFGKNPYEQAYGFFKAAGVTDEWINRFKKVI